MEIAFELVTVGDEGGSLIFTLKVKSVVSLGCIGVNMNQSVRVPVDTLDTIASRYALETIDYLKLDFEAHGLEALKQANRLMREKRIRAITFEFDGCSID